MIWFTNRWFWLTVVAVTGLILMLTGSVHAATVTLLYPEEGAVVGQPVAIEAQAVGVGLVDLDIYIDDVLIAATSGSGTVNLFVGRVIRKNGWHHVRAEARDADGTASDEARVRVKRR